MIELRIAACDSTTALYECARHNMPGPIIAEPVENCDCGFIHAYVFGEHDEDTNSSLESWFASGRSLVDATEYAS